MKKILSIVLAAGMLASPAAQGGEYAEKVNTLIGNQGVGLTSGYLYPGATIPFGMVQFTPSYFSKRSGFVINQLSGGGCAHMGNFPTFPIKGALEVSPEDILSYRIGVSDEKGHAGLYHAKVQDDIDASLTVTDRTGMAQYQWPADSKLGTVIIGGGIAATPIEEAAIAITGPRSCEGYSTGGNFCGLPTPYKVYFVAEFDRDATVSGIWKDEHLQAGGRFVEGPMSGVYFTFDTASDHEVKYKIGVSYVSVENARENLRAENPGWDFNAVATAAENRWDDYLSRIDVKGTNPDRITQFYTHLYHALIHPNLCSDVNGEYMGADFKVHKTKSKQYTSFSNWDTYRTQIQLLSMLDPEVASEVVISHRDFAEQSGGSFPRWVMANIETGVMQGDPSAILVSNAWAFGARNYDPKPLLKIMRKGAEEPGAKSQDYETRPGLKQYLDKGWFDASIQLEYTSADFAIGQFALRACGDEFLSYRYFHHARSWRNLVNEDGWIQSRDAEGNWRPLDQDFREATYPNYFWMVPYDIDGLIEVAGGKDKAEARLDHLVRRIDAGYFDEWYASGNEPSFQIPWTYNWIGKPYKTQELVNRVINKQYSSAIDGLPGNDDLGTMGAWYVFACMGLYPQIPGIGGFAINTPIFSDITITLPRDRKISIKGGSENNIYINSLKVNGKTHDSTWIDWDTLADGAQLEYTTSSRPNKSWGTTTPPPSYK